MTQAPKVGDWVVRKHEFAIGDYVWRGFCEENKRGIDGMFQVSSVRGISIRLAPDNNVYWHWTRFDIVQPIVGKSLEDYL